MRDVIVGLLGAYCMVAALILLTDLPDWLIGPLVLAAFGGVMAYVALDIRRVTRRRAAIKKALQWRVR